MKKLLLIGLLFTAFHALSQQLLVDSLEIALIKETDILRKIDLHLGLNRAYGFNGDYKKSAFHCSEAKRLALNHGYKRGEAIALLFEGTLNVVNGGSVELSRINAKKALDIARSINSKPIIVMARYFEAEHYLYLKENYKEALKALNTARAEIDETVPDKHIGNVYKTIASVYELMGRDSLAILNFEQAISYFKRIKDEPFIIPELGKASSMDADKGLMNLGQVHIYLGRIYSKNGYFESALAEMKQAESIYNQGQAGVYEAWAIEELGDVYNDYNHIEKAIDHFQKAIKIYERINASSDLANIYQKVGDLFAIMKEETAAAEYFLKSLDFYKQSKDTIKFIDGLVGLGQLSLEANQSDEALNYFENAYRQSIEIGDSVGLSAVLLLIGKTHFVKNDFEIAQSFLEQSLRINKRFNIQNETFQSEVYLAKNAIKLGNLEQAKSYLENVDSTADFFDHTGFKMQVADTYSHWYEAKGDFSSALRSYKKYFQLNQTLYTEQAQEKLKEEQVRQNVSIIQKEKKIAEREVALLNSRNRLFIVGIAIALLVLITVSYLLLQLRKTKQKLEVQNDELQQLNRTKDKFFGIIAHDIRSPIIALEGVGEQMDFYLKKDRKDKLGRLANRIDSTAKGLNALLDNLLNWALLQQGVVPYKPEIISLSNLCETTFKMFQDSAAAKNIHLQTTIDPQLKVLADEAALYSILRNLISNAIKFTPKGGKIAVSATRFDTEIRLQVNDTGLGISANKLSKLFTLEKKSEDGTAGERGTGLGLTLVKELVELNKGSIAVESEVGEGSCFSVDLPVAA